MDFLKSAVASAIAKGSALPCTIGDRLDNSDSVFALHKGTRRVRITFPYSRDNMS